MGGTRPQGLGSINIISLTSFLTLSRVYKLPWICSYPVELVGGSRDLWLGSNFKSRHEYNCGGSAGLPHKSRHEDNCRVGRQMWTITITGVLVCFGEGNLPSKAKIYRQESTCRANNTSIKEEPAVPRSHLVVVGTKGGDRPKGQRSLYNIYTTSFMSSPGHADILRDWWVGPGTRA